MSPAPSLALVPPPPQSDPPPASIVRPIPPTEPLDMATSEQILDALRGVESKLDDVKTDVGEIKATNAATAEWRKAAEKATEKHEERLDALEKADRARELSIVRIIAWAGGAGAVSGVLGSAIVAIVVAVIVRALTKQ